MVNRQSPYAGSCAQESIDCAMALSNFGQQISVFFIEDGVFQLLSGQQAKLVERKAFTKGFAALHFYDIENIYVCAQSLTVRGLHADKLSVAVKVLTSSELSKVLAAHKHVVTF